MAKPETIPDNVVAIGAALDQPVDAPDLSQPGPGDPRDEDGDDDGIYRPLLPKDAPVRALGMRDQMCFYLDVQGQLIALGPRDHGKNNILALFSPRTHLPTKYWPQWSAPKVDRKTGEVIKPSEIVGFNQADASEALIASCGLAGIFDKSGKVRSRGAHPGRAGALVVHCGDKIMVSARRVDGSARPGVWHDPGLIDGYVYTAAGPAPRPVAEAVSEDAGERILQLLNTWRWKRPGVDAMLALGWAGQAYICGALGWRSHVFVTGGAGTGKSTLNGKGGVFDRLLGAGALRTGNATEAAVRQTLGAQTIPVIFDEFEATEFNPMRTKAIVELARVASSGAEFHKGGQDHNAHEFVLQSAFQFSAILMPELQPQDRSRFAILELKPFPAPDPSDYADEDEQPDTKIDLDKLKLPELGRQLQRRMIDGWPRFGETLKVYQRALERNGHAQRGQDTFGTLLACADLLLYDFAPADRDDGRDHVDALAKRCAADKMAEIAAAVDEHEACLNRLAFAAVQARGGDERSTIAEWVSRALKDEESHAPRWLQHIGLRLVTMRATPSGALGAVDFKVGDKDPFLAVAGDHPGLATIFADSRWQRGAWSQALSRIDNAVGGVRVRFDGRPLRATCVPIGAVLELDASDAGKAGAA